MKNVFYDVDCWTATDIGPNDVFGIDWSSNKGFGRFEIIMDEQGKPHLNTEHMCNNNNKQFAYDLLKHIVDIAIIEE